MYDRVYFDNDKTEFFFGNSLDQERFIEQGHTLVTDPKEILSIISRDIYIRIDRGETKFNPELIKTYMTLMIQLL